VRIAGVEVQMGTFFSQYNKKNSKRISHRPFVLVNGPKDETRFMLKALLEMWDFEVADSSNVSESIDLAKNRRPELIIVDASALSDESLETVSMYRAKEEFRDVPCIVISGFSRADFRKAAIEHGANDLLVKPIDFDFFESYLGEITHSSKETRSAGGNA
jgi:DNA-binding response OmpR family regulator